jgi:hypothetical protein
MLARRFGNRRRQTVGAESKRIDSGETREFPKGKLELVSVGGHTFARGTFQPGWRWSQDVKPMAGTDSCQATHVGYAISGRLGARLDDGTELEVGGGEAYIIPAGHDGWVIGEEPYVFVDVQTAE